MYTGLMKKGLSIAVSALCLFGLLGLFGCAGNNAQSSADGSSGLNGESEISVYSREDGSGTRGAFVELFGLEEKDAKGNKVDTTTQSAAITNSTSVMMSSVANDPASIGYISLGSLNHTVKALSIDGVEATPENVKNGDYKISRSFNIVTPESLSAPAQDFIGFITSADGQAIVEDNSYVTVVDNAAPYAPSGASGKVVVAGSSSVTPVMEKLAEAYKAVNPDVTIEVQQSDSTTGVNMAIDGTCDIGMASRDLKDSELSSGVSATAIAKDGIAVIVAPSFALDELTSEQVRSIFSGDTVSWAEVIG